MHDAHYNNERKHENGNDSRQDTPQSSKSNNGEMSASAAALPIENYHLDTLHVPKRRRMRGVPHKSPGPKALVSSGSDTKRRMSLNFVMDDMFRDQTEPGLDAHNGKTDAFFN